MRRRIALWLVVAASLTGCATQKTTGDFSVMSYNLENLFDTEDDPHINDNEFLPTGDKEWTTERYTKKLENMASVIAMQDVFPDVVGVCEVENRKVLEDLVGQKSIKAAKYDIIHFDSRDRRGIDVAMLYRKGSMKVLNAMLISTAMPDDANFRSRDVLLVSGKLANGDTIHLFMNHWPSRSGGQAESEPKRVFVAGVLRHAVDSLFAINPNAKIAIFGDFNDEPNNISITQTLLNGSSLTNLMAPMKENGLGSYYYKNDWSMLDQFIVSPGLLNAQSGLRIIANGAKIITDDKITYSKKDGTKAPNRTFAGKKYVGGYSDHFPIILKMKEN